MDREGDLDRSNTQAEGNSIAIGGISVGGNAGDIRIGHTIGYTADQVAVLITQISTTFQAKTFDGRCPYKGLDVFEEEDAELFFGREKLVEDLVGRVKGSRTLFVTGPSGSGKSSLVRAGLIHALKQGKAKEFNSERWLYGTMKPGRDPTDALANAFSRLKSPELGNYLRQHVDQVSVLQECAESALTERKDQRLVLFIDQFEEIFTQINKDEERVNFLNLLTHAATIENGRVIILFSMRSDFVPNCATYPQLNSLLNQQFIQIGSMQPDELVSAIAQPALRVGLRIEPDLVSQIINDMKGEPGALPLMQFALKDLFDGEQATGGMIALTLNEYFQRGGIQKSLERHADSAFAELNEHEQELARSIFTGLIEIGRGTLNTRRTALANELIPAGAQTGDVNTVVQKLANARLITTDKVTVTISHEKLIDAWPWLKKLVNENRDVIALQNEIVEDAEEWEKHARDASYLYTGARLANASEKLEVKKLVLSGLAQNFVNAGIQMEESKRQGEEKRRQKEIEDAHKLAATERRARLITNAMLGAASILIAALSFAPIRNEVWRQQAMGLALIPIPESNVILGDSRYNNEDPVFLPKDSYSIEAFRIERYEVTNERYLLCVNSGNCSFPIAPSASYDGEANRSLPAVKITAIQASQFCTWLGRRLPSDLQWERAARYVDERLWPWGNSTPSPELANLFYEAEPMLQPVGHLMNGKSPEGIHDLAGNVLEWTRSAYSNPEKSELDLNSVKESDRLSVRGGGYNTNYESMNNTIAFRFPASPFAFNNAIGFRCVSK